jgi:hypothetical protein
VELFFYTAFAHRLAQSCGDLDVFADIGKPARDLKKLPENVSLKSAQ